MRLARPGTGWLGAGGARGWARDDAGAPQQQRRHPVRGVPVRAALRRLGQRPRDRVAVGSRRGLHLREQRLDADHRTARGRGMGRRLGPNRPPRRCARVRRLSRSDASERALRGGIPAPPPRRHVRDRQRPGLSARPRYRIGAVPRRCARGHGTTGGGGARARERRAARRGRRGHGRRARRQGPRRPIPDRERRHERAARRRAGRGDRTHGPRPGRRGLGAPRRAGPRGARRRRRRRGGGARRRDVPHDEASAPRRRGCDRGRDRRRHGHLGRARTACPRRAARPAHASPQLLQLGPRRRRRGARRSARCARDAVRRARVRPARRPNDRDDPPVRLREQARCVALGRDRRGGHADHAGRPRTRERLLRFDRRPARAPAAPAWKAAGLRGASGARPAKRRRDPGRPVRRVHRAAGFRR